ncbi:MAG: signal peptidase I [Roseburia sp.]|nr:signal peptidase I [Roseburia sp.]
MIGEKKAYIISSVILAIAASICLIFAVQVVTRGYVNIGGYSLFRVVTGSMEPTIPTGAILICKDTEIDQINTGDIVCYRTKVAEIYGSIVTHRVADIKQDENGAIQLETRGDANMSSDPYYVDAANLIGRVTWYSGKESVLNNMLSFLSGKIGFFVCIVFPVLLVSGLILQNAVKNLQKELMLARYELERGVAEEISEEIKDSELLPGYTTLTYADYEAIYETLRKELMEELNGRNQEPDREQEG